MRGTSKITTNAIIDDETTTDDERVVSSKKFWRGISRLLAIANTWSLKQTFTTAPRLLSTTASQRLEVDSNKDIISVVKGTADNKDFGTGTSNIPEIGLTLGNSQVVETNASGKLITATKGTAYNKDFGITSGTVAEGNDIRFKSDMQLICEALGSTIIASTFPIDRVTSSYTLVDTRMDVQAVYIRESKTIAGVKWFQGVQGNYTADNYNGVGLYSYDGAGTLTLVASSTNDGNIWKASANSVGSKAFSSKIGRASCRERV